ncbi:MAG: molybdate ABC transporter substrate-binding protein [Anaerolineales bacterium]|nr:molybdate ABC transporter substrate-binding protein [Anaerolineales bacterium]
MRRFNLLGILILIILLAACAQPTEIPLLATAAPVVGVTASIDADSLNGTLTVYAAGSLTESFSEIKTAFKAAYPDVVVEINFAGSQQLALQLSEGGQADVFASANLKKMDEVVAAGRISKDKPVIFAHNKLVVIAPVENPAGIIEMTDLSEIGNKIVLGSEEVPAGNYARQIIAKVAADPAFGPEYEEAVLANIVSNEDNVKQVVAKVQLGEVDAGIVYRTDVTPDIIDNFVLVNIPDEYNVIADYPIAILNDTSKPELAAAFVDFVLNGEGHDILSKWGFMVD